MTVPPPFRCGCDCGCRKPGISQVHPGLRYRDCCAGRHISEVVSLAPRPQVGYPGATMPLSLWASEAVSHLTDRSHLVIVEGSLEINRGGTTPDHQSVLVLARVLDHPGRHEIQPLGLVLDTHLSEMLQIDEDALVYSLVEDPG